MMSDVSMTTNNPRFSLGRYLAAWSVHVLTASTAVVGVLTLFAISRQQYIEALWWMGAAIVIDAIDGSFARLVDVKRVLPNIDGALLDNIVDYLNYVITPCFLLVMHPNMLPDNWQWFVVSCIALSSAYQFTQADAKTPDHFFKGFPSYWNIIVFYLFIFHTGPMSNGIILIFLSIMVFIPIKYVYPSRLDYLTELPWLKVTMLMATILYGINSALLLWDYPNKHSVFVTYSLAYVIFYLGFSLFRTYVPLLKEKISQVSNR